MRRPVLVLSMTLALGVGASTADASPINIVAARSVEIGNSTGPVFGSSASATGTYVDAVGHPVQASGGGLVSVAAAQDTLIDGAAGAFSGKGSANVGYSVLASQGIYARSIFDAYFDLPSPHSYTLAGSLAANDDGGFARARLGLTGPVGFSFVAVGTAPDSAMAASGVLPAGAYHLIVEAAMDNGGSPQDGAAMGGQASYEFEFLVTRHDRTVPEPTVMALLGLGVARGISRRARR